MVATANTRLVMV